ncbi:hypothetical protein C5167_035643 [Papaver somniferum]|uniref:Lipoxygenase n=1 Tax=Papaver somniferum TaxID=3469 RepID=A0A4Y7KGJ2_PAPSO|nr:hypothetical protein C5167_035643 [Papaver somniferum]
MKKNKLDLTDYGASFLDRVHELFGNGVCLQLISSDNADKDNEMRGKVGKEAYLEDWVNKITSLTAGLSEFHVTFEWGESTGIPGAFFIKNFHHSEFFLKTLILEDVPGSGFTLPNITSILGFSFLTREDELKVLRGDGAGELQAWDRVYDYALYNDLGTERPVLGNSTELPYPRRGRTGRKPDKKDFLAYVVKALGQVVRPEIKAVFDKTPNEFDSFDDVLHLYEGYQGRPVNQTGDSHLLSSNWTLNLELVKELFPDEFAWRTDEEFGREMLAGVNPVSIRLLQEFPPTSKLDTTLYGDHTNSITKEHIEKNLNGITVNEALEKNMLFILDHHDELIPYLNRINATGTKTYATRTILYLQEDGTLKPLAIELSLLAKAYAAVNDSGVHQLIVIEPFVIATNRQLSVLHPIFKLLQPHFRDTMHINALTRHILINAGGFVERTVFPEKYAMELSATIYKGWNFTEQSLPQNLLKRGIAVQDPSKPHGLRLLIEDYPYAVDGLEIWSAIEKWVYEYCSFYYPTDELIQGDTELQSWWEDLRTKGHGDLKDEPWWPKMQTLPELTQSCTIIIWIASALHAAVNFGMYAYAGYLPNRPTVSRRFMPEIGDPEYVELETNPDAVFLKTITSQLQTLLGISLIEALSKHSADEVYLGQRDCPDYWTKDATPLDAFNRFGEKLVNIENKIVEMNNAEEYKNRFGPVKIPYTLLCPYPLPSDPLGLTGRGIPNSTSL